MKLSFPITVENESDLKSLLALIQATNTLPVPKAVQREPLQLSDANWRPKEVKEKQFKSLVKIKRQGPKLPLTEEVKELRREIMKALILKYPKRGNSYLVNKFRKKTGVSAGYVVLKDLRDMGSLPVTKAENQGLSPEVATKVLETLKEMCRQDSSRFMFGSKYPVGIPWGKFCSFAKRNPTLDSRLSAVHISPELLEAVKNLAGLTEEDIKGLTPQPRIFLCDTPNRVAGRAAIERGWYTLKI